VGFRGFFPIPKGIGREKWEILGKERKGMGKRLGKSINFPRKTWEKFWESFGKEKTESGKTTPFFEPPFSHFLAS